MLTKRIIPCLDIKDGQTVKGVNFVDLIHAGDPIELAQRYVEQGADELVFLDITATVEQRKTFAELVSKIAKAINIPFTVGGGISTIADVDKLLNAGADKVSINSSAVKKPNLIDDLSKQFGAQCIVVAIDTKLDEDWKVYVKGGREATPLYTKDWAKEVQERGAGEILLTSMNHDGTKQGFALDITGWCANNLKIPVIASGGAGKKEHFIDVFQKANADAALAASIFHFGEIPIPELKQFLQKNNISVRI
ncbi:MAG TPA: imidazole glycerol phosphate synthase subunit HisF [Chitinophagales bacterium]|nr:imidazole glycerol phosphate synthase subunit HisF [Chitinophagales bacterium]MCB9074547.1 imidazole glycerol phosphate synthase subunit HisF [Chitinophagales bacterium]HMU97473.1 imidazole glycerol phosphate synthase subunit HisF [Chitinophagales bacterium]HMV01868.1 imidazole glycerol phosphate synthase subunit HisF [Chitinophagales bacterium]HMW93698.1 imidazole glycerol phosphate synthase subunit HisF [Chitinophagales bacterium]